MLQIRRVSDLRNKFPDILDAYSKLTDGVEAALREADRLAAEDDRKTSYDSFSIFG